MKKLLIKNEIESHSKIGHICKYANIEIVKEGDHDAALLHDAYALTPKNDIETNKRVINGKLVSTSKNYTDTMFEEVFGYPISVTKGKCYRKSIKQATKDLIEYDLDTLPKEEGYVYQKRLNYEVAKDTFIKFRLFVINSEVRFVYCMKSKTMLESYWGITPDNIGNPFIFVNQKDIMLTNKFCKKIGLEWGELDAAYDRDNGLFYIFDVNNTPSGANLPNHSSKEMIDYFYILYAYYFNQML